MSEFRAFFAEFDDQKGPVIVFDEPVGSLSEGSEGRYRVWETFSDYVMTGNPLLDGKVVQVRCGEDAVLCLPVVLKDDQKYSRNALLFSIGVAVPGDALEACAAACGNALLRSARALRAMELETSALSQRRQHKTLARILPLALRRLRAAAGTAAASASRRRRRRRHPEKEEDFLVAVSDDSHEDLDADPNVFSLGRPWYTHHKTFPKFFFEEEKKKKKTTATSDEVQHWQVPVLLARPRDLLDLGRHEKAYVAGRRRYGAWYAGGETWDLAVQQVMPHVDGIRNVWQVARVSHVDVDIVARSLRVLRYFGCLAVIDTFQYSNVYRATLRTKELASTPEALDACVAFVLRIPASDLDLAIFASSSSSSNGLANLQQTTTSADDNDDCSDRFCNNTRLRHRPKKPPRDDAPTTTTRGRRGSSSNALSPKKGLPVPYSTDEPDDEEDLDLQESSRRRRRKSGDVRRRSADLVLRLYCAFVDGKSLKDVLLECDSRLLVQHLDHRAFAAYGAVHGLLERVHRYPAAIERTTGRKYHRRHNSDDKLLRNNSNKEPLASTHKPATPPIKKTTSHGNFGHLSPIRSKLTAAAVLEQKASQDDKQDTFLKQALDLMDGSNCMDAICSTLQMPPNHLEGLLTHAGYDIRDIYR